MTHMRHFFVLPTCPGVSGQVCIFWGALDDEEFFVIESSGVTGTTGVRLPGVLSRVFYN